MKKLPKKTVSIWRLVAKSLGEKSGRDDRESDRIAIIRFLMFLSIFTTNSFIVANALRHWNDIDYESSKTKVECQKF
jgi:hypothetical protein